MIDRQIYLAEYRASHREDAKEYTRRWRGRNPDYYEQNKERECNRAKEHDEKHERNRDYIRHALEDKFNGTPCMDCDKVYPPYVMDFDHRPDEEKCFEISSKKRHIYTAEKFSEVMEEVKKCDYVCSNCHRERTHRRNNVC